MNCHPLVTQLRFARSEFVRCLEGVSAEDAVRRIMPMNCISWIVGHLANQEQAYWVLVAQGRLVVPGLNDLVGYGKPASTPPLDEMWAAWRTITQAADEYLDTLTTELLQTHLVFKGGPRPESIGTMGLAGFSGMLMTIVPPKTPCYRCLYPNPPKEITAPSSAEVGIMGMVPGIIGSLQALEAVKLLLGIGSTLGGRVLFFDGLEPGFEEMRLERNPDCPVCGRLTG